MHIQIMAEQNPIAGAEVLIQSVESVLQKFRKQHSTEDLTWKYAKEIDLNTDVYIELISDKQLKVGVLRMVNDGIANNLIENRALNDLHWITIEDQTLDQLDLVPKFLLFIIGMVFIPSQMGTFMTDWADLKIALQYGHTAKYINLNESNADFLASSKIIASSVMLLNEDLSFSNKLNLASNLIPQAIVNKDYLSIINITDSNYLPKSNILLLIS